MAYIADLDSLELDSYDNNELKKLAVKIIKAIGPQGAWDTLEASADVIMPVTKCYIVAIRQNPDEPLTLDALAYAKKTIDFEDAKDNMIPIFAMASYQSSRLLGQLGKEVGLGPAGVSELLIREVQRIARLHGDDPDIELIGRKA